MTTPLFELDDSDSMPASEKQPKQRIGKPRLRTPQRDQVEMQFFALDQLLDPVHPARSVWAAVAALDLSLWLVRIQAVDHAPGRDATDPRLLVALWVYATVRGVGSARELAQLCGDQGELPYRWLCGGVSINHHTLSDFRTDNGEAWDRLVTQITAALMHEGLVMLERVAQDGMRVQASAGDGSFRRRATLEACLQEACEQTAALKALSEEHPHELSKRQKAARERAAREREQRVRQALENCAELQRQRENAAKQAGRPAKEARASTTDPEARNMKFPDGGYAPGYNVQFSTDTASGVIVGVDVINSGTDYEAFVPMLEQLQERYDRMPAEGLLDGGFVSREVIDNAADQGCTVYAPPIGVERQLAEGKNPFEKKRRDSAAVAQWRERMGTAAAQTIYKLRGQTAEWVNMFARNRNFRTMPVRGLAKSKTIAALFAVTHNLLEGMKLRAEASMKSS